VIVGNDLFCYRHKGDAAHRVMHSLTGTFIKETPPEASQSEACTLYPVKIMLPPNKSRILYFRDQAVATNWNNVLKSLVGYSNMFEYYNVETDLGKG
jgi:hypothetical protein